MRMDQRAWWVGGRPGPKGQPIVCMESHSPSGGMREPLAIACCSRRVKPVRTEELQVEAELGKGPPCSISQRRRRAMPDSP